MVGTRVLRWVGLFAVAIIIVVIVVIAFVHSGYYNVAATYPDNAPTAWVLSNTMDHSVRRNARDTKVPANMDNPAMIRAGLHHYGEDCIICHGAPGVRTGEIGRGLNPKPPRLTEAANDWKPNELFWIAKNGVRMTGMPACGIADTDEELWNTVAFVRKLPSMSPAEYKALSQQKNPMEESPHHHTHL